MEINLLLLMVSAIFTATVSGFVGMAGGVMLLAIMTMLLPIQAIVPIHGIVQLVSNFSRAIILRKNIKVSVFLYFMMGVPIGGTGVYFVLKRISRPEWALGIIALLLLYVVFRPKSLPQIKIPAWGYFILGIVASFLGCLIGATGPLLAPFFIRDDFSKEEIVATKASQQILIHLVKIPVFVSLVFPYQDYLWEMVLMVAGVVIGTKIGTSLLKKASSQQFIIFLKTAMFFIALRLIYKLVIEFT